MDFLIPPIYRPPSEAHSLLLQATVGCSHNECTYCNMYINKKFKTTPLETLRQQTQSSLAIDPGTRRVFLCDGDAFVLSTRKLTAILDMLNQEIPDLQRVGIYAYAPNIRNKSDQDLRDLKARKLSMAYVGLESGHNPTLKRVRKGADAQDHITLVTRLQNAGIKCSVICLLGISPSDQRHDAALATAQVLNAMQPRYVSFLTATPVEGTVFYEQVTNGSHQLPSARESLEELRLILENLELDNCLFASNHASSYLPLRGTLNKDKAALCQNLDAAIAGDMPMKPEWMRGL